MSESRRQPTHTLFLAGAGLGYTLMRSTQQTPIDLLAHRRALWRVRQSELRSHSDRHRRGSLFPALRPDLALTPFVSPRLSVDVCASSCGGVGTDLKLNFDIGASLDVTSSIGIHCGADVGGVERRQQPDRVRHWPRRIVRTWRRAARLQRVRGRHSAAHIRRARVPPHARPGALMDRSSAQSILVVDDNDDNAEIVRALLESRGFPVLIAHDGDEATGALRVRAPIAGAARCADARAQWLGSVPPHAPASRARPHVCASSCSRRSRSGTTSSPRCRPGADDYITKPIDLADLELRVRRNLALVTPHA